MPELDLMGLLQGQYRTYAGDLDATAQPVLGVTVGVVTAVEDEQHLGRVKVQLPLLSERVESAWAQIAVPWAGQRRGSYLLPEVNDEVLVAFRHGDAAHPIVVGFLWNPKDPPPQTSPGRNIRELRSKKGHVVQFDDTDGREKVTVASSGGLEVTLDDATKQVTVAAGGTSPRARVVIETDGQRISITSPQGDISLQAPKGEVSIAGASIKLQATSGVTVSGNPVHLNPPVPALPAISTGVG